MSRKVQDPHSNSLFPGLQDFGDVFSEDRTYRFRLWRIWDKSLPLMSFTMLNPSKATWQQLDNTCFKVQTFAQQLGAGGFIVTNCFALISTNPVGLYTHPNPVGADNDAHILAAAQQADQVVVAWGNHARHMDRSRQVLALIAAAGKAPYCFKVNEATGEPGHPLYLPGNSELQPYAARAA